MKKLRSFPYRAEPGSQFKLWAVTACLLFALSLAAQQEPPQKITGKIFSKNQYSPLVGATVTVRGTSNAVVSNEKGEFAIAALPGQVLVVSLVGYTPMELKV